MARSFLSTAHFCDADRTIIVLAAKFGPLRLSLQKLIRLCFRRRRLETPFFLLLSTCMERASAMPDTSKGAWWAKDSSTTTTFAEENRTLLGGRTCGKLPRKKHDESTTTTGNQGAAAVLMTDADLWVHRPRAMSRATAHGIELR